MFYDVPRYLHGLADHCVEETHELLEFWASHAMDDIYQGICPCVDREGSRTSDQKPVWFQGRSLYGFGSAYNEISKEPRWLEVCDSLYAFLMKHCFVPGDPHGKMYYILEQDGTPVSTMNNIFSETFAAMGLAEYYRATGKKQVLDEMRQVYENLLFYWANPAYIDTGKLNETGESQRCPMPWYMMLLCTTQTLRRADPEREAFYTGNAAKLIGELKRFYYDPEMELFREKLPTEDPGHGFEIAWFTMAEAMYTHDKELMAFSAAFTKKLYGLAYDEEFGGVPTRISYTDPSFEDDSHNHKIWWLQNELLLALIYAYKATGDLWFLERFRMAHEYVNAHMIDRKYGEWYARLNRQGVPCLLEKGSTTKGPFHTVRQYVAIYDLLTKDGKENPNE